MGFGYFCPGSTASGLQWGHSLTFLRLPGTLEEALPFLVAAAKGWGISASLSFKKAQREHSLGGACFFCQTAPYYHPILISGNGPPPS